MVLRSHYFGLKAIFEGWQLPRPPANSTVSSAFDDLKNHYAKLSRRFKFEVRPQEAMINNLGYQIMGSGQMEQAISIFEYNIKLYPASANVYDSLGEAQEKINKINSARVSYKKAWQLGKKYKDANTEIFKKNYDRVIQMKVKRVIY